MEEFLSSESMLALRKDMLTSQPWPRVERGAGARHLLHQRNIFVLKQWTWGIKLSHGGISILRKRRRLVARKPNYRGVKIKMLLRLSDSLPRVTWEEVMFMSQKCHRTRKQELEVKWTGRCKIEVMKFFCICLYVCVAFISLLRNLTRYTGCSRAFE